MKGDPWAQERRELVGRLDRAGYINTPTVREAFLRVPRERFVPEDVRSSAYKDVPLPIGHGQTISAPSMIAIMLEEAALGPGEKVLEIGTGSGYTSALLAEIVGPGNVVSIERLRELEPFGRENLRSAGYDVRVVLGDGTRGYPPDAPYDCILATAGAPRMPRAWMDQTKVGGRVVAPIGRSRLSQILMTARRVATDRWEFKEGTPCSFVPLVGEDAWTHE
ncbi:MAG TPA: protein-L-isoaspartate(D-aspartate) O-methyltransferase [Thermoplasmata archaeon]